MLAYLFQHVVKESQSSLDVAVSVAVQVQAYVDVSLLGGTSHLRLPLAAIGYCCRFVPVAYLQELAADVGSKLSVRVSVSNDIAVCNVVSWRVHVLLHQSGVGLAGGSIVFREVRVDEDVVKLHSLALQCVDDEVLYGPEGVFWKSLRSQTVLIGHHDEQVVRMLSEEDEVGDGTRHELQLLEAVYLLVLWLTDNRSVAVYE